MQRLSWEAFLWRLGSNGFHSGLCHTTSIVSFVPILLERQTRLCGWIRASRRFSYTVFFFSDGEHIIVEALDIEFGETGEGVEGPGSYLGYVEDESCGIRIEESSA